MIVHSLDLGVSKFTSNVSPSLPPPGDLCRDEIVIPPFEIDTDGESTSQHNARYTWSRWPLNQR